MNFTRTNLVRLFDGSAKNTLKNLRVIKNKPELWSVKENELHARIIPGTIFDKFAAEYPASNIFVSVCDGSVVPSTPAFTPLQLTVPTALSELTAGQPVHVDLTKKSLPWSVSVSVTSDFQIYGEQAGLLLCSDDEPVSANTIKLVLERLKDGLTKVVFGITTDSCSKTVKKVELCVTGKVTVPLMMVVDACNVVSAYVAKSCISTAAEFDQTLTVDDIEYVRMGVYDMYANTSSATGLATTTLRAGLMAHGPLKVESAYTELDVVLTDASVGSLASDLESTLSFRHAQAGELDMLHAIEASSYPEDEMASLEGFTYRQRVANDFFMVAEAPVADVARLFNVEVSTAPTETVVLGYICGTASVCHDGELDHDLMWKHDVGGETLCIHSVCVDQRFRGKGVAHSMLSHYVHAVKQAVLRTRAATSTNTTINDVIVAEKALLKPYQTTTTTADCVETSLPHLQRVVLLSKPHNVGLYSRVGFVDEGEAHVSHGSEKWHHCSLNI